ncbi:hypothetical protein J2Z65_005134 [Paenibacillus aceris]|uniref:Transposase n=1 Tax=Paenibacillus aceris TaxID=869555 RepID=A0ABS4I6Z6_9BACL|nr:hypothetical protein [Paenibacillus aceris]
MEFETFEQAHHKFLEGHLGRRTGERKGRLVRGHNFAEKLLLQNVWWPLFGNFDNLHSEVAVPRLCIPPPVWPLRH